MTVRPEDRGSQRVPPLDGVRGVAILMVLVHTLSGIVAPSTLALPRLILGIGQPGWTGVQLFFVLSGYLITGILLDSLGSARYFERFYVRRALRIFPLYYAVLIAVFVVVPLSGVYPGWSDEAVPHQWWYWTYLSNWVNPLGIGVLGLSHFWSLAVEEQFYLFWPALVAAVPRQRLLVLCVAALVLTPLVRLGLDGLGMPRAAGYTFTIARWDALAGGAAIALLWRTPRGREWMRRSMPVIGATAVLVLVTLVVVVRDFGPSVLPIQVVGQSVAIAISVVLVHSVIDPSGGLTIALARGLSNAWLRFLGKYSYGIYVLLTPINVLGAMYLRREVNEGGGLAVSGKALLYILMTAAVTILAAMVSWRILERPCLNLRERIAPAASLST